MKWAILMAGAALVAGCSSGPSREEQAKIDQRCQTTLCYCVILNPNSQTGSPARAPRIDASTGFKYCDPGQRFEVPKL